MLDVFTARGRPPWTLLGMPHFRKRGMGILNTRQGEVCMVAPPLLDVQTKTLIFFIRMSLDHWPFNDFSRLAHPSSTLYCSLLDSYWILQDIMIFRSWPIPHKLCIVNHQGWSSLLYLFKLKRWFFSLECYRILDHFRWSSLLHWFKLKRWFFSLVCHWILDHFDYNQDWILIEFYCKQSFHGRDTTRASHTSHM